MKFCGQIQLLPNFLGVNTPSTQLRLFRFGLFFILNKIILGIFENYPNVKNFVALLKNFTQLYIEQKKKFTQTSKFEILKNI